MQSAKLDGTFHLIFTLTDGTEVDVGAVRGEKGEPGANGTNGKDGAGIQSVTLNTADGKYELVLTLDDASGTTKTVDISELKGADGATGKDGAPGARGPQGLQGDPGKDGRGILKTEIIDGHLYITYTDAPDAPVDVGIVGDGSSSEEFTPTYTMYDPDMFEFTDIGDNKVRIKLKSGYQNSVGYCIDIPETSPDGKTIAQIGGSAFYGSNLVGIRIPKSVEAIMSSAFSNCENLVDVNLSNTDNLSYILSSAFRECTLLEKIKLPNSMKVIGDYAFFGCTSLREINIPENVISIGINTNFLNNKYVISDSGEYGAFQECPNLKYASFAKPDDWEYGYYSDEESYRNPKWGGWQSVTVDLSNPFVGAYQLKNVYCREYHSNNTLKSSYSAAFRKKQ